MLKSASTAGLWLLLCANAMATDAYSCVQYASVVQVAIAMKKGGQPQAATNEMIFEIHHVYGPHGIVLRNSAEEAAAITRIVSDVYSKDTSRFENPKSLHEEGELIDEVRTECMRGNPLFGSD